ncbi:hypothetical protein [Burkholderia ambifaria]|uniref:hypothetical protein n=1 Tax=Burkholderia ambifaria TaxID=152480 RepID=UPI00158C3B72|nr:hypothetical protein [Burkholderia ambifaria]
MRKTGRATGTSRGRFFCAALPAAARDAIAPDRSLLFDFRPKLREQKSKCRKRQPEGKLAAVRVGFDVGLNVGFGVTDYFDLSP